MHVKPTPVERAVAEAVRSCRILASNTGVDLQLVTGAAASTQALMDEAWFRRALANLIINAIEAMGRGGKVEVSVDVLDEHQRRQLAGTFPHEVVVIRVRDDGPGVSRDLAERIFEPFFTTKSAGSGLGLSVAADVVESFGGVLTVTTRPGWGCRFDIYPAGRGVRACWEHNACDRAECARCPVYTEGTGFGCWALRHLMGGESPACRHGECTQCEVYCGDNLRVNWRGSLISFVEA